MAERWEYKSYVCFPKSPAVRGDRLIREGIRIVRESALAARKGFRIVPELPRHRLLKHHWMYSLENTLSELEMSMSLVFTFACNVAFSRWLIPRGPPIGDRSYQNVHVDSGLA